MATYKFIPLVAALLFSASAFSQVQLWSKTFHGKGPCNGGDVLAELTPGGGVYTKLMHPWEPVPILIVGVEILAFDAIPAYVLAGNAYAPDVMMMGTGRMTRTMFPAGMGFPLPASGGNAHIDLHYSCTEGNFQAFYTIYYTK